MFVRLLTVLGIGLLLAPASLAQRGQIPGWASDPFSGTLVLDRGFQPDPRVVGVEPGGNVANPISGSGCVGFLSSAPDLAVQYRTSGGTDLTFSAASATDIGLVVRTPRGQYLCDDDGGEGTNPLLTVRNAAAGEYRVWAAVYQAAGQIADGLIGVSETGDAVSLTPSGSPSKRSAVTGSRGQTRAVASDGRASGTLQNATAVAYYGSVLLSPGFGYEPRVVDVLAGGVHPNALQGDGCVGFLDDRAGFSLDYTAGRNGLTFSATGGDDLNLVVRTPSGVYYCNDDATGADPRIDLATSETGTYRIWVGTWTSTSRLARAHVGISETGVVVR